MSLKAAVYTLFADYARRRRFYRPGRYIRANLPTVRYRFRLVSIGGGITFTRRPFGGTFRFVSCLARNVQYHYRYCCYRSGVTRYAYRYSRYNYVRYV